MKKTFLLFFCTFLMTGFLFFSGIYLLDLVAMSDTLAAALQIGDGDEDAGGLAASGVSDTGGVSGIPFISQFSPYSSNDFVDVLLSFKQDSSEPINILILAGDEGVNTDSIMVMRFNPKNAQINIMSIPRDTYITLSGYKFHKINSVYAVKNGSDHLKKLLEEMLGQKIGYYVHINMKVVREVVDLLDGVDYDVPCDMVYSDPTQNLNINLKKGLRTLTGKQVEGLLRFRHPNKWTKEVRQYYDGSDLKRIERLHDFINVMAKQKLTVRYIPKVNDIINNVYSNIKTDLPLSEMLKIARSLPSVSADCIQSATLPGEAKYIDGLSYYVHSPKQSQALAETMLGDAPPPPPVDTP